MSTCGGTICYYWTNFFFLFLLVLCHNAHSGTSWKRNSKILHGWDSSHRISLLDGWDWSHLISDQFWHNDLRVILHNEFTSRWVCNGRPISWKEFSKQGNEATDNVPSGRRERAHAWKFNPSLLWFSLAISTAWVLSKHWSCLYIKYLYTHPMECSVTERYSKSGLPWKTNSTKTGKSNR